MEIAVTGGAGMIGSNLVRRLLSRGHQVRVIDNFWRGTQSNLDWATSGQMDAIKIFDLDVARDQGLAEAFDGADVVYHLADIVAGINFVFANEYSVWSENMLINSRALTATIEAGVKKYIYVGTACSYPSHLTKLQSSDLRLVEGDVFPANPESSYGWSKLMGEYEIGLAEDAGLVEAVVLRLHNVYGFPAELSPERSQVIPALIRKALRYPHEDFVVWGSGNQKRSFVWVGDVVDALEKALSLNSPGGTIQIGPESSTSIREIADLTLELAGVAAVPVFDTAMPEGDQDRVGDFSKARELLGWQPRTSLREGLAMTIDWARSVLNQR